MMKHASGADCLAGVNVDFPQACAKWSIRGNSQPRREK